MRLPNAGHAVINELDIVALTRPLPEFGLVAGDT